LYGSGLYFICVGLLLSELPLRHLKISNNKYWSRVWQWFICLTPTALEILSSR